MPENPNLGYGKPTEASIDQVNIWMRGQPWYQEQMRAWGQNPASPTLSKEQSRQILRMAQAQGVVVDEGDMEIDNHGNFNPKGHKLRNTLIVAGLAGATLATMGAAGAFAGAGGAASAGGAGGAAATGAGSAAGIGGAAAVPAALGGTLVPTIAPGLATSLSAGSMIGGGTAAAAGGGGLLGTLGSIGRNGERLRDVGGMLTEGAQGLSAGRRADSYADAQMAGQNNRALLDAAIFNRDTPSVRTSQVARGDILSTMQDAAPTGDPRIDKFGGGGLRPSAFGDASRQAGEALKRKALEDLMSGGQFTPQTVTPRRAGVGENVMAGTGMGLNILSTLDRFGRR